MWDVIGNALWLIFLAVDLWLYAIESAKHGPFYQLWPGSGFWQAYKSWRGR